MEMKLREMRRPLARAFPAFRGSSEWSAQGTLEYLPGAGCLNTPESVNKYLLSQHPGKHLLNTACINPPKSIRIIPNN